MEWLNEDNQKQIVASRSLPARLLSLGLASMQNGPFYMTQDKGSNLHHSALTGLRLLSTCSDIELL
eukprot:scaffold30456_cov33-Prasinocladus_malaysianus.AAC.1